MLSSSSRAAPASRAARTSSRSAHSTSTGTPAGASRRARSVASPTPPARRAWFSLTSTASNRPRRWLCPPPASTACFSSARSPGVVLRVSRIRTPGALHGPHVARRERGDAGQPAEEVERHPLRREDRAGVAGHLRHQAALAPLALLGARASSAASGRLAGTRSRRPARPAITPACLLLDARPRDGVRRHHRRRRSGLPRRRPPRAPGRSARPLPDHPSRLDRRTCLSPVLEVSGKDPRGTGPRDPAGDVRPQ